MCWRSLAKKCSFECTSFHGQTKRFKMQQKICSFKFFKIVQNWCSHLKGKFVIDRFGPMQWYQSFTVVGHLKSLHSLDKAILPSWTDGTPISTLFYSAAASTTSIWTTNLSSVKVCRWWERECGSCSGEVLFSKTASTPWTAVTRDIWVLVKAV